MSRSSANRIKEPMQDRVFDTINIVFFALLLLIFAYPLYFVIVASVSSPSAVLTGKVTLWPVDPTWEGYDMILGYKDIWSGYANTILYVVLGVPLGLLLTLTVAYPLSRRDFIPRNTIMMIFTFTMFFGGGLIPTYLLIKDMGMLNTIWSAIIPGCMGVYNVIVTRTYFQTNIPEELREAASLDGCTDFGFFIRIAIPLSMPIVAVIGLFYFVDKWNMFFQAMIYITNRKLYPLQLILKEILVSNKLTPEMLEGFSPSQYDTLLQITNIMKYGVIIVSTVPVLCVYPFVQKYFVKGIMIGAIKG